MNIFFCILKKTIKWLAIVSTLVAVVLVVMYNIVIEPIPPLKATKQLQTNTISKVENQHLHGSSIAQLPNGDMIATWFEGSGEKRHNDVKIMASTYNGKKWDKPYVIADTPNLPDINPVIFVNNNDVWLFYFTTRFNTWQSSVLKYKKGVWNKGKINWSAVKQMPINLENPEFKKPFIDRLKYQLETSRDSFVNALNDKQLVFHINDKQRFNIIVDNWVEKIIVKSLYKIIWWGYSEYVTALFDGSYHKKDRWFFPEVMPEMNANYGWQTRSKPIIHNGRIILPIYADVYQLTIMAYTDDNGKSWNFSNPIVAGANIQPTIIANKNGDLLAYMRDNGLYPKKVLLSVSKDMGKTWSIPQDLELPNPGSAIDVVKLKNGNILMVYNNDDENRYSLALNTSLDGINWNNEQTIYYNPKYPPSYPAMIVDKSGNVHITFSGGDKDGTIEHYTFKTQ